MKTKFDKPKMKEKNNLEKSLDSLDKIYGSLREAYEILGRMNYMIGWWNASSKDALYAVKTAISGAVLVFGLAGIISYSLLKNPPPNNKQESVYSNEVICRQIGSGKDIIKFLDYKPFGSVDEIVKIQDGKVVTLNPNDDRFGKEEEIY